MLLPRGHGRLEPLQRLRAGARRIFNGHGLRAGVDGDLQRASEDRVGRADLELRHGVAGLQGHTPDVERVRVEEAKARSGFAFARDTVAVLGPPPSRGGELSEEWAGRVGGAAELRTDRLHLRPVATDDAPLVRQLLTDATVRAHLGGPVSEERVAARQTTYPTTAGAWTVVRAADDQPVGLVTIGSDHRCEGAAEISYQLLPSAWGKGLGREAVAALLDWLGVDDVEVSALVEQQVADLEARGPKR